MNLQLYGLNQRGNQFYPPDKKGSSKHLRYLAGMAWKNGNAKKALKLEEKAAKAEYKEKLGNVRTTYHATWKDTGRIK